MLVKPMRLRWIYFLTTAHHFLRSMIYPPPPLTRNWTYNSSIHSAVYHFPTCPSHLEVACGCLFLQLVLHHQASETSSGVEKPPKHNSIPLNATVWVYLCGIYSSRSICSSSCSSEVPIWLDNWSGSRLWMKVSVTAKTRCALLQCLQDHLFVVRVPTFITLLRLTPSFSDSLPAALYCTQC